MLSAALALALVGDVGIAIEEARGVSGEDVSSIAEGLVEAVSARTGAAKIDTGPRCERADRCIDDVRRRVGTSDLLLVRVIGVPTRLRLFVTHVAADGTKRDEAVDVARSRGKWAPAWRRLAATLFDAKPEVPPPPPPPLAASPPPPPSPPPSIVAPPPPAAPPEADPSIGPWIVLGASVATLATGIGFGFSSRGARQTAANEPKTPSELRDLEDRAIDHGTIANVMFGTSAVAAGAGIVWLLLE